MPHPPAIVLVNTQLPENIGAAARAMMNFGLRELRLVAPREGWPNARAWDLAAHAGEILDNAKIYPTTGEAVADCRRVYAATARPREMIKQVLSPAESAQCMSTETDVPAAILFGPERTGLTNDDITLADAIITIPTGSALASLNVAQSVVVIAYQWFCIAQSAHSSPGDLQSESTGSSPAGSRFCAAEGGSQNDKISPVMKRGTTGPYASAVGAAVNANSDYASKQDLLHFFNHLERELDAADYWKVDHKKAKMWLNLRNIFTRVNLTENEVRTLHGVISALTGSGRSSQ